MNKTTILLSFIFLGMSKLMAFPPDSVSTGYKHGEFVTTCQVHVNASDSICTAVTHSFDNQLKNNFDALFGWALKGMNLRNEEKKNDLLIFYFKSTRYNKTTNIIRGIGDITVPGIMTSPDIFVDIRITTKKYSNGKTCFYIDFINSNGFIKNMSCIFSILPERGKSTRMVMETHTSFGWFYDFFITEKKFKSLIEWRLTQFVKNLKEEAERREKRPLAPKVEF